MATSQRPNFLLFITDQQRFDHLACAGNAVVKTPNIDSIAKKGVRFTRFTVASPVCQPNRATLMTGRLPSLHGVRHNGLALSLRANTFVELMRVAGWRTALVGKSHIQNMVGPPPAYKREWGTDGKATPPEGLREALRDDEDLAGYEQEIPSRWEDSGHRMRLPFYGFEQVELCDGHGDLCHGDYLRWAEARHPNMRGLMGPENQLPGNSMTVPQAWRTAVPVELYPTTFIAERTNAILEDWAKSDRSQPFMIQCSFNDPHHPFTPPGKYWDMYDPAAMPLPSGFDLGNAKPTPQEAWLHAQRDDGTRFARAQAAFAVTAEETKEALALTYGMITMVDDAIGTVLAKLAELGLEGDTIVAFTSDHGDLMGDHQLMLKGSFANRGLVQVPFIWADPFLPRRAGTTSDALCGTLDLAATCLDRSGLEPYNGIQGMSVVPAIEGRDNEGHDGIIVEYGAQRPFMGKTGILAMRSLITRRWRLTMYRGEDWGELYDLESDPDEKINLWDDPAHRTVRGEMAERLARTMMDQSESSPLPLGTA